MTLEPWQIDFLEGNLDGPLADVLELHARASHRRQRMLYFVAACIANGIEVKVVSTSEREAQRVYEEARRLLEEIPAGEIPRVSQDRV